MEQYTGQYAKRLTTTIKMLREAGAASNFLYCLSKKFHPKEDVPFNVMTSMDLGVLWKDDGYEYVLWSLRATKEPCSTVARLMAADFAESLLPIYERDYPGGEQYRECVAAIRKYATGKIDRDEWRDCRKQCRNLGQMLRLTWESRSYGLGALDCYEPLYSAMSSTIESEVANTARLSLITSSCRGLPGEMNRYVKDAAYLASLESQKDITRKYLILDQA